MTAAAPFDLLTARERECLRLVDQHLSSKEIGRRLGISKHTVDAHVDKARQKIGADSRYDAARKVIAWERDGWERSAGQGDAGERDEGIPTASGYDPIGIAPPSRSPSDGLRNGGLDARSKTDAGATERDADQRGDHPLQGQGGGRSDGDSRGYAGADLHLGGVGAATHGAGGERSLQGLGADPGVGHPQAGDVQAAGAGAARGALHRFGADGRELPSGWRGGRNDLSPLQRLGVILAIVIGSALGFGAILAGLHALKDLV